LKAFSPSLAEVELAAHIVAAAQAQDWAPISVDGKLHDRASYRYFWQVLERAHQTGCAMPANAQAFFVSPLPQLQGQTGTQTAIN
jgi:citrate lyase subunit beta/citryl-CoA lyase